MLEGGMTVCMRFVRRRPVGRASSCLFVDKSTHAHTHSTTHIYIHIHPTHPRRT